MSDTQRQAAGILFRANDGSILFLRRGDGAADAPGTWGIPGGHCDEGESLEDCARRETLEETGFKFKGKLAPLYTAGQFTAFLADWNDRPFDVTICDESSGFAWTKLDALPEPLHPGVPNMLRCLTADTELAVAELMRDGVIGSPYLYGNVTLFALRITGTGSAWRSAANKGKGEHVYRPPEHYLTGEFLRRCNGLTVVWVHPEKATLDSKEYAQRAIGSIFLPYLKNDEVWGIAKVYDETAIKEMSTKQLSTSPGVVLQGNGADVKITLDNGESLLIEGKPFLLDHLAVEEYGVWDKGGEPSGVSLTTEEIMPETIAAAATATDAKLDQVLAAVGAVSTSQQALNGRFDAMEKRVDAMGDDGKAAMDKAKKDADDKEAAEKKAAADDKAKKDAEEKEASEAAEKKAMDDKAKKDAEESEAKAKADAEEKAKCDAETPHFAGFQSKADAVYHAFGDSAPRQLTGERLLPYRRRLLEPLKKHSASFAGVDLNTITTPDLMAVAERQIFADAGSAARNPVDLPVGTLREIRTPDATGRNIITFQGSPSACWGAFKAPGRRVTGMLQGRIAQ